MFFLLIAGYNSLSSVSFNLINIHTALRKCLDSETLDASELGSALVHASAGLSLSASLATVGPSISLVDASPGPSLFFASLFEESRSTVVPGSTISTSVCSCSFVVVRPSSASVTVPCRAFFFSFSSFFRCLFLFLFW